MRVRPTTSSLGRFFRIKSPAGRAYFFSTHFCTYSSMPSRHPLAVADCFCAVLSVQGDRSVLELCRPQSNLVRL